MKLYFNRTKSEIVAILEPGDEVTCKSINDLNNESDFQPMFLMASHKNLCKKITFCDNVVKSW